jgi:hypothetical protein
MGFRAWIARYEFLSGCAFIAGSPVLFLGNAKTTRNNMVKNDNEKRATMAA